VGGNLRAGTGGSAQVAGVEAGDGGLDSRGQVMGVVVEDLGQPVPGVGGAGGGGPQRPDVVAGFVQAAVGLPGGAASQVLAGVGEGDPGEERPVVDLLRGGGVRGREGVDGRAVGMLGRAGVRAR